MEEPTHDMSARSTDISKAEGRLKENISGGLSKKKKRSILKKIIKKKKYGY